MSAPSSFDSDIETKPSLVESITTDEETLKRVSSLVTPRNIETVGSAISESTSNDENSNDNNTQYTRASASTQAFATPPRSSTSRASWANERTSFQPSERGSQLVEIYEIQPDEEQGGTLVERWDPRLPRPPSNPQMMEGEENTDYNPNAETVCVFNANTKEGSTIVKVLSAKKINVIAVVRVFTSPIAKQLMKCNFVTVKVASWNDKDSLLQVASGCTKGYLMTKYWEKFENQLEEQMAMNVLLACAQVGITQLVLANFEDTATLKTTQQKSQLLPILRRGKIYPKFKGMKRIYKKAKQLNVQITNMMTTYFSSSDNNSMSNASENSMNEDVTALDTRKSLTLIRSPNGEIVWSCSNTQDYSAPAIGMEL